jgi:hypothetical protein
MPCQFTKRDVEAAEQAAQGMGEHSVIAYRFLGGTVAHPHIPVRWVNIKLSSATSVPRTWPSALSLCFSEHSQDVNSNDAPGTEPSRDSERRIKLRYCGKIGRRCPSPWIQF